MILPDNYTMITRITFVFLFTLIVPMATRQRQDLGEDLAEQRVYDFTQHIRDILSMILPDKYSMILLFINVYISFQVDCPDGQLGKDIYSMILLNE
jgi:hypothetical protein